MLAHIPATFHFNLVIDGVDIGHPGNNGWPTSHQWQCRKTVIDDEPSTVAITYDGKDLLFRQDVMNVVAPLTNYPCVGP